MLIPLSLVTLIWFSTTQAVHKCDNVHISCQQDVSWTRCYEDNMTTCVMGRSFGRNENFKRQLWNLFEEAKVNLQEHHIQIPSSALQRTRGHVSDGKVQVVASVITSSHFKLAPPTKTRLYNQYKRAEGSVMGEFVLLVRAGNESLTNLLQPIILTFKHNKQVKNGTCVFWQETYPTTGTGYWSPDGCNTSMSGSEFICSCNHLSFFAILVNPSISVDPSNSANLTYITYAGSALSVLFTVISLIVYLCLQRRRPEKAIGVHMHLTGALLCLHLSFLLSSFRVWLLGKNEEDWVCRTLGFFLHWSLLASLSWMALEGFHLYLLLIRVFNIYVRRYLLKLSLVGWGVPTLAAVVCGVLGVYGKNNLHLRDASSPNTTAQMCWMSSNFAHWQLVSYITTVAFPCLVILCNFCMLLVVVFKMWRLRGGHGGVGSSGVWKNMKKENGSRLWKDCATVLGLSCVLGLPWGLAATTYISLTGIYVFTILNSLQGVFMFLWSMALTYKTRSDTNTSIRDPSSQKMITTSFNN